MSEPREYPTIRLPNGCTLYIADNEVGGRRYMSDEVGGGVVVWDTAVVDASTLLAAIVTEESLLFSEKRKGAVPPAPVTT